MTSNTLILMIVNLLAVTILTFGIYFPRHKRRDLVTAFYGANIGVFAIAATLGSTEIALGLGLGLFGVLSIIRLRSSEISQRDVAYYFSSLALGLIAGITHTDLLLPLILMGLIVITVAIIDSRSILGGVKHQTIKLDQALADEAELSEMLALRLNAKILGVTVLHLDYVNDTTEVDVRYSPKPTLPKTKTLTVIHNEEVAHERV